MKMGIFCKVNSALITFSFLFFSRKIVQEFLLIFPKIFFLKSPFLGSLDDDHLQGVAISSHYLLKRNLIDFFNSFFFLTVRMDALDNCFISRAWQYCQNVIRKKRQSEQFDGNRTFSSSLCCFTKQIPCMILL